MMTLEKCAAVLNRSGKNYSVEEIKQIRNLLYNFARFDELVRRENGGGKDGSDLYSGEYGRAS